MSIERAQADWAPRGPRPVDPVVRELWDREQIRAALARYCRGIDRCDAEMIRSAYHPDAHDDHGVFLGSPEEFAAWAIAGLTRVEQSTTHQLTDVMIDVRGDRARCESRFVGSHVSDRPDGCLAIHQFYGRYLDVLRYAEGRWAIADRRTVYDWTESRVTRRVHDADDPRFAHGSRGEKDPVRRGWDAFDAGAR